MRKYLGMPKVQVAVILLLLFLVVSPIIGIQLALYTLLTCVGFTVALDLAFTFLRRQTFFRPFGALVTGLILTLIIDPSAIWYQILIICTAAMGIKNFLRIGNRHIFNPAASGLVVGWGLFGLNPGWWGATLYSGQNALLMNILLYVLLGALAYVSVYKLRRSHSVLSYLVVMALLFPFAISSLSLQTIFRTVTSFGTLFYAVLMLPEPMTSPVSKKRQLMYGGLVALINAGLVYVTFTQQLGNFPDSSIVALLIGNAMFFRFR